LKRSKPKSPHSILREAAKEARELMILVSKGKLIPLKEVPSLNFLDLKNIPIKKGDYIMCQGKGNDGKGLRYLESRRVGAIITPVKVDSLAPAANESLSWSLSVFVSLAMSKILRYFAGRGFSSQTR